MVDKTGDAQPRDEAGRWAEGDAFTPETGDRICAEIAGGKSMRSICKEDWAPSRRVIFDWLRRHPEFKTNYDIACAERTEGYVEECLEIADDSSGDLTKTEDGTVVNHENIQRSRLRVDTRKWIAAKMLPKRYGDKIELDGAVDVRHRLLING